MKNPARFISLFSLTALVCAAAIPNPARWDELLKRYVDAEARVDYSAWKQKGMEDLDSFLGEVAASWPDGMPPADRKAALINAYNALTVRWVLTNYPVRSIRQTPDPFQAVRHTVDGKRVSLDQIETELRAMKDPRIHAALVCAARSCPPLRREAYAADRLDAQLDDNTRAWLANTRLNQFDPDRNLASVSPIFDWYSKDFAAAGGLPAFLAHHAPQGRGAFLLRDGARIKYNGYDWGLNDTLANGAAYSRWRLYTDVIMNDPRAGWAAGGIALLSVLALLWRIGRRKTGIRRARRV